MSQEDLAEWQDDPESFVLGTVGPRMVETEAPRNPLPTPSLLSPTPLDSLLALCLEEAEAARARSFKEAALADDLVMAIMAANGKEAVQALTQLYGSAAAEDPRQALLLQDACLSALGLGLGEKTFDKKAFDVSLSLSLILTLTLTLIQRPLTYRTGLRTS